MPTQPLSDRRLNYMDRYARVLGAAYRVDQIRKDVADEQGRVQYLDSLIGQERQTLAALAETFRTPPVDFTEGQRLLKEQAALTGAIRGAEAGAAAGAAAAAKLTGAESQALSLAIGSGQRAAALATAKEIIAAKPGAAAQVVAEAIRTVGRSGLTPSDVKALQDAAALAKPRPGGVSKAAREALALQEQAFKESLESAYFAGPAGIRGGYAGLERATLRDLTPEGLRERAAGADADGGARLLEKADALEASAFATEDEALQAALAVVRATGDPAEIKDAFARNVYEDTRQKQAYRNDQRADFEEEVLTSRKRLATLESDRARIADAYDDPSQEVLRRELTARGYTFYDRKGAEAWKNSYVKHQNTPDYPLYLGAHERVAGALEKGKPLAPSNRAENIVTSFTMMLKRKGAPISIDLLRSQLDKAGIKGKEQEQAITFSMAYWELGGPDQDPATLALKQKDIEARKAEGERAQVEATKARSEAEQQRKLVDQMEKEQVTAVGDLRAAQADAAFPAKEYARLRAMGMSPEDARAKAMQVVPERRPTAPLASKVLMTPEALLERQRRTTEDAPTTGAVMKLPGLDIPREPEAVADPTNPSYSYRLSPSGEGYVVLKNGVPTGAAKKGTRAFKSIESVLAGGKPLAAAPAPAPAPATGPAAELAEQQRQAREYLNAGKAPAKPVSSAPAPASPAPKVETEAEREARLLRALGL